ncbi:StAR-related lipid transfer protein 13 [Merluccius polli]|uniref:StAR-related lipid transfer protein 13 n=1 Tax=Merluccius polli TaxID=89951 RepID=A0AA47N1E8_MERPO|nr:StAR-related lipid transfer protein 13 [Merluccius polli]
MYNAVSVCVLSPDSQFPIDISPVKRDHDFLDKDLVEPLCRRLITLNKCASMKLDVNLPKKKSEDSDEDDVFAISDRWTFEWTSRRWSRLQDIDGFLGNQGEGLPNGGSGAPLKAATSSESVLTDLSEPEVSSLHSESSGGSAPRGGGRSTEDSDGSNQTGSDSAAMPDPTSVSLSHISRDGTRYGVLPRKHARLGRTRAKDFLKRMETLRSRGALAGGRETLVISAPVLRDDAPAGPKGVRCVEIVNGEAPPLPSVGGRTATSQSTGEGSGCTSSGGSTPSLKERSARREDHKRSGMYLEDLDIFSAGQVKRVGEQNRHNDFCSHEDLVVHIPKDHKPGTFPKALSIESLSPTITTSSAHGNGTPTSGPAGRVRPDAPVLQLTSTKEPRPVTQCCSRGSRISVYDNVPGSHLYASTGDLIDLEKEDLFPHLDDILLHVNGLQQIVDRWSQNVLPGAEGKTQGGVRGGEAGSPGGSRLSSQITLDFEGNSAREGRGTPSDGDRDHVSLAEMDAPQVRERRDSGVGASLTRPKRLRWPSFQIANRLSLSVASLQITNQSAGQLKVLSAAPDGYHGEVLHVQPPRLDLFMKRMKVPDYKDKNVFGVPLMVHVQRSGQPLPLSLQQALRYLRSQCLDQVGLFRKSGVKSRIQALRQMNESSPDNVDYQDQSAYDVADMVKQFFRDLPEPLLTSKLGETFLHIYQCEYLSWAKFLFLVLTLQLFIFFSSASQNCETCTKYKQTSPRTRGCRPVQAAIMLMSDENREVLQTLLCFLSDVTSSVEENQMTPMNIAVCLAPSLFHLNLLKKDNLSPRATVCFESRNSYVEADLRAPTVSELCRQLEEDDGTLPTHMENRLQNLLREAREKSKYWVSCSSADNTELSYKKVGDGNPLRRWRVSVEVEAPPSVVLNRALRERHLWDVDLLQWKVTESLDRQTEVFQYVLNRMAPHPSRDFVVVRSWRTDLPKGACSLVSASVEREDCPLLGGVRAVVLESSYLLEPCGSGKSRLTHICRVDLRGRTSDWYNKVFGHLCAAEAARIRNSFQPIIADGPETKI